MRRQIVVAIVALSGLTGLASNTWASSNPTSTGGQNNRSVVLPAASGSRFTHALSDRRTIPLGLAERGVPLPFGAVARPSKGGL